ncbi:MAG: DoxX family protein [Planctomycetota bacterium]
MNTTILFWASRFIAAGIMLIGSLPKFTGGAAALADKLPGGVAAVYAIGVAELAALILLLVPRTALIGAGLAFVLMLGATASHIVGPVGFEGDFAMMFVLALVALAASGSYLALAIKQRDPAPTAIAAE